MKLPSLVSEGRTCPVGRTEQVLTVATAIAVFVFRSSDSIAATWTSDAGLPGLALQWALIRLRLLEQVSYQALAILSQPAFILLPLARALPGEVEGGLRHVLNNV